MVNVDAHFRHRQVALRSASIRVVETGDFEAPPVLFLHGWPESWHAWRAVMALAAPQVRAIAIDLPGIGESAGTTTDGSKRQLAHVVHELITELRLTHVVLVGQDVGGMITYAYLREYDDLAGAVIMSVVVPGIDPWAEVLRNPYIWHFAMHAIPELPEHLVTGREARYFDYFFDILSPRPSAISAAARADYVRAYQHPGALTAGFDWYRAFPGDADANSKDAGQSASTRLLYLRGEHEPGDITAYVDGLRSAGVSQVEHALVPGGGHFSPEDAPHEVWRLISRFASSQQVQAES